MLHADAACCIHTWQATVTVIRHQSQAVRQSGWSGIAAVFSVDLDHCSLVGQGVVEAMATKPSSAGAVPGGISGSVGLPEEFKELRGHLLVEAIFARYGAGTMTIPWINEHANPDSPEYRNIRRDPCNRKIMESLAEAYADRILHSGLNVDCSGHLVLNHSACSLIAKWPM